MGFFTQVKSTSKKSILPGEKKKRNFDQDRNDEFSIEVYKSMSKAD